MYVGLSVSMNNIPNIISCLRILSSPALLYLAHLGYRDFFLGLLIVSLLSDVLDGFLARKLNASTNLGAKLDSIGDMAIYFSVPLCAWWLWPDLVRQEAFYFILTVSAYAIPPFAGLLKFRKLISYHTLSAKIAAYIMCTAILIVFLSENTLMFRFAAVFQSLVACESIMITLWLPSLRNNVKSIWHVYRRLNT